MNEILTYKAEMLFNQVSTLIKTKDILDIEYINSLPQPLWDGDWPIYDIDVETGLYRIDVCGILEVRHIDQSHSIRDATGTNHYVDDFYLDKNKWGSRT